MFILKLWAAMLLSEPISLSAHLPYKASFKTYGMVCGQYTINGRELKVIGNILYVFMLFHRSVIFTIIIF